MRRKDLILIALSLVVSIITMTIAYAALNVSLSIYGNAQIMASNWDIHLENIKVSKDSVTDGEATITSTTTASFSTTLSKPGDFYEFTVEIKNSGSIDAMISSISKEPNLFEKQAKYLNYIITYDNGDSILDKQIVKSGEFVRLKIKLEFKKDINVVDLPSIVEELEFSFNVNYVQSDESGITSPTPVVNVIPDDTDTMIYNAENLDPNIAYTNINIKKADRTIIGYSGTKDETLVIPAAYQTEDGTWYKVTSIDSYTFNNCDNLKSVIIPDTVTKIGDYAFQGCDKLESVTIGNSVTSIGNRAFAGDNLIEINVDENNNVYSSEDGVLFSKDKKKLIMFPMGVKGEYSIPNTVEVIGEDAFTHSLISLVNIPDSVLIIEDSAFYASDITKFIIPDSVISIEPYAFGACYELESIVIGNSVSEIPNSAFYYSSAKTITLGRSVSSIGTDAFVYNTSLTSIIVNEDNENFISDDGILFNKDKTTLMVFPAGKSGTYSIPNSVSTIASKAFQYSHLSSIIMNDNVKLIEEYAFYYSYINSIKLSNSITEIKEYTFYNSYIYSINIPSSVTSIGYSAFESCNNLTSIEIPSSVTSIGSYAFSYSGLKTIVLPNSLTTLSSDMFRYSYLESITIPASITKIDSYVFYDCYYLESIVFENPNGWSTADVWGGNKVTFTDGLLDDKQNAEYFKDTYYDFYWNRS